MEAPATTYAQLLAKQAPGCQVLAHVGAFEKIQTWTLHSGAVYRCDIAQRQTIHSLRVISSVTIANPALTTPVAVALTYRTSIADVASNLGSFFFDTATNRLYISLAASANPNGQIAFAGFTLYFSTGSPTEAGRCFINESTGDVYYPYICAAPNTDKAIEDPFLGSITTGTATLGLDASTGNLDAIWRLYVWDYGSVVVLFGGDGLPLTEYATLFVGSTSGKAWNDGVAELHLVDGCDPLLQSISGALFTSTDISNSYAYTGSGSYGYGHQSVSSNVGAFSLAIGSGGGINSTGTITQVVELGQPKPIVYGTLAGFSGVVVGVMNTSTTAQTAVVCVSDTAYQSITQVYVGGRSAGVSWWINASSGFVAVMLTLGVAGGAASINEGITIDFDSTELSAGVLMTNPADIVAALCATIRAGASAVTRVLTSEDALTVFNFNSSNGFLPGLAPYTPTSWSATVDSWTSNPTWNFESRYAAGNEGTSFDYKPFPIGSLRPVKYGAQTNFDPQYWAVLNNAPRLHPSGYKYYISLVCLGTSYVSISAVRVWNGASWVTTGVNWWPDATNGVLLLICWGTSPGADPVGYTYQIDFTGPTAPVTPAPTNPPDGPLLSLNTDVLAASRTTCSDYVIALAITEATVLRDILIRIARDTLSYVYVNNAGLICFDTYSPVTTGEVALTEETGDYIVSPEVSEQSDRCYRAVLVEYALDPNRENLQGGLYLTASKTIADSIGLLTGRTVDFQVDASLHTTEASALVLANRLAKLTSRGAPVYRITAPIKALALDLGDKVSVSRERLPVAAPGTLAHCYVTRIAVDTQNVQVTLELTENLISDLAGGW